MKLHIPKSLLVIALFAFGLLLGRGTAQASPTPAIELPHLIPNASFSGEVQYTVTTLSYASSKQLDFRSTPYQSITLTGDLTLTTTNLAAGRGITLRVVGDSSTRNLSFPAGWTFIGAAAPPTLAANKTAILTMVSFGTADSSVIAAYSAQP